MLKEKSSRNNRPVSIKLGTNLPWGKGIQICIKKGQFLFKGEIITIMQNLAKSLKNFLLEYYIRCQNMSYLHESFLT
jgi:hypothetical protein